MLMLTGLPVWPAELVGGARDGGELDLTIVFHAGNYSDRVGFRIQEELIPQYILPAIME